MAKRAVILEPGDRRKRAVVDMLSTIRAEKSAKRSSKQTERLETISKKKAAETAKFEPVAREERKRKFMEKGKEDAFRANKRSKGRG
jgi:hypothetical protein